MSSTVLVLSLELLGSYFVTNVGTDLQRHQSTLMRSIVHATLWYNEKHSFHFNMCDKCGGQMQNYSFVFRDPIAPGKPGKITVTFQSWKYGILKF